MTADLFSVSYFLMKLLFQWVLRKSSLKPDLPYNVRKCVISNSKSMTFFISF